MPAEPSLDWPSSVEGAPAVAVLEQAIEQGRLSHSLLLTGGNLETLQAVALAIADRLLNVPRSSAPFPPEQHPDCFILRPTKKSRQIGAEETRELIGKVQVSSVVSPHKVAILVECDRMNTAAANVFLKTLEEPPRHTTLLLLTTRPYSILPTIRSRCLHFRFPSPPETFAADGWPAWCDDYTAWLTCLPGLSDRKAAGEMLLVAYGLVARFDSVLTHATETEWKRQKTTLPEDLTKDEVEAIESGIANGLKLRLFREIEAVTRAFALPYVQSEDEGVSRAYTQVIDHLEKSVGLLRVNLNEAAVLEEFLLGSMRLWARKG